MNKKLDAIEKIIRYHYWNNDCAHKSYEGCCAVIVSEIIKVTGYQPRCKTIEADSQ